MTELKINELVEKVGTEFSINKFNSLYPKPNCKLLGVGVTVCTVRNLNDGKLKQLPSLIVWNSLFY